jgi:hypothetical protein
MRTHLTLFSMLLLLPACTHTREPVTEGCIDGVVRPADLTFVADSSGREYTLLTGDAGTPHLNLRPYAGRHLTVCGPVDPKFRILHARILTPP